MPNEDISYSPVISGECNFIIVVWITHVSNMTLSTMGNMCLKSAGVYATHSTNYPKKWTVTLTSSTSGSPAAETQLSSYVVRSGGMVKFFYIMRARWKRIEIMMKAKPLILFIV